MKAYKVTIMVSEEGRFNRDSFRSYKYFFNKEDAIAIENNFKTSNFHKVFIEEIEIN